MIILEVYMDMKKIVFVTAFVCLLPHEIIAQDDMYFTPKKADKTETVQEQPKMYTGSFRNVDEYNRHGRFAGVSQEVDLDTLYSDVVFFDADTSTVAGDTILVSDVTDAADYAYDPSEDYEYSRRLSRYDDYYWHDPWYYGWYGYGPYWYGSPYWYAGWWYDPWYDPWFYGWHRPWGWYYSWYWPVSYHRPYYGVTGTSNHGRPYRHGSVGSGNFKGYRGTNNRVSSNRNNYDRDNNRTNYSNRFRGNRQNNFNRNNYQSRPSYNNSFGGSRSGGSFRGGGSFGGSRGGGGGGGFRGRR